MTNPATALHHYAGLNWRGIATRYDKYALTYLGGVLLACAVIHSMALSAVELACLK